MNTDKIDDNVTPTGHLGRYANIMLDTAFKISFGKEIGRQNMLDLLHCLLPELDIRDITYDDKEQPGLFLSEKKSIFDLSCTTGSGERIVVEMQIAKRSTYQERMLFYATFPLRNQLLTPLEESRIRFTGQKKRLKDYALRPVYVVSIVNFSLEHVGPESLEEGLVSRYALLNRRAPQEEMTKALNFVFLELGRLPYREDESDRCRTPLEKLAYSFKYGSKLQTVPAGFTETFIKNLYHTMEIENYNLAKRTEYELELLQELERNSALTAALEDGRAEGLAKGLAEGREKGLAEGLAEGEASKALQIAGNLKQSGISPDIIVAATGLTLEQVEAL